LHTCFLAESGLLKKSSCLDGYRLIKIIFYEGGKQ
jgi:hypothetical protein